MNVQGLDLNLLRVFDTVLRDRSVTAAAKHLGLTQPAVSNALARVRYPSGPDILDLHIKAVWSSGVIVLSPRVVQRRQLPSTFDEL